MGLYVPALWKAVGDRLAGDSTLVALLAGGSANSITSYLPQPATDASASYPWVTFRLIDRSVAESEPFETRNHIVTFSVLLFVQERPVSSVSTDPLVTLAKIEERVLGDWSEQSTRVPTYGLDRWQPDFSGHTGDAVSTYSPTEILYQGTSDQSESGLLSWELSFQVQINKQRP